MKTAEAVECDGSFGAKIGEIGSMPRKIHVFHATTRDKLVGGKSITHARWAKLNHSTIRNHSLIPLKVLAMLPFGLIPQVSPEKNHLLKFGRFALERTEPTNENNKTRNNFKRKSEMNLSKATTVGGVLKIRKEVEIMVVALTRRESNFQGLHFKHTMAGPTNRLYIYLHASRKMFRKDDGEQRTLSDMRPSEQPRQNIVSDNLNIFIGLSEQQGMHHPVVNLDGLIEGPGFAVQLPTHIGVGDSIGAAVQDNERKVDIREPLIEEFDDGAQPRLSAIPQRVHVGDEFLAGNLDGLEEEIGGGDDGESGEESGEEGFRGEEVNEEADGGAHGLAEEKRGEVLELGVLLFDRVEEGEAIVCDEVYGGDEESSRTLTLFVGSFVDRGAESAKVVLAEAGVGEGVGGNGESKESSGELGGSEEERDQRHRNACFSC
ncbi:uncharacterized protein HKW66_Vig0237820 [Vigna angularis]|uniref:Uncharacterized protein n=1 Tax=Phaseolus angularis TaxID=3914 RepID=A0A8T0KXT3_PHAAN|nr:uncharacterized protein HKW66_Vig0237820 [Vigna angularis]